MTALALAVYAQQAAAGASTAYVVWLGETSS
jgi:hypothetical protein